MNAAEAESRRWYNQPAYAGNGQGGPVAPYALADQGPVRNGIDEALRERSYQSSRPADRLSFNAIRGRT